MRKAEHTRSRSRGSVLRIANLISSLPLAPSVAMGTKTTGAVAAVLLLGTFALYSTYALSGKRSERFWGRWRCHDRAVLLLHVCAQKLVRAVQGML